MPTPVVELNAAAAVARTDRLADGLAWVEEVDRRGVLADYHLVAAAKADLLRQARRPAEAAAEYRRALEQVRNPAERAYLARRLREVTGG